MPWPSCKFIAIDLATHTIHLLDSASEDTFGSFPLPAGSVPVGLALGEGKACVAVRDSGEGGLYIVRLKQPQLYRLPLSIAQPLQFAADSALQCAYCVAKDATLYRLDLAALTSRAIAQPSDAICNGIAVESGKVYTAWETKAGDGVLAVFSSAGEFLCEYKIPGIPTNLLVHSGVAYLPFTDSRIYGEGLALITENNLPRYITIHSPEAANALRAYPCSVTIDDEKKIAYVVNEDSGSVTTIDLCGETVSGSFSIGRSITHLHLLADRRFALATSNMFADLSLLDLVNQKLLSICDSHEFSALLAVLP